MHISNTLYLRKHWNVAVGQGHFHKPMMMLSRTFCPEAITFPHSTPVMKISLKRKGQIRQHQAQHFDWPGRRVYIHPSVGRALVILVGICLDLKPVHPAAKMSSPWLLVSVTPWCCHAPMALICRDLCCY